MNTENTNETFTTEDGLHTHEEKASPFELKIGGAEGIDNADVPVRWCITPEFVTQMESEGITDPHILLVSYDPDVDRHHSLAQMNRVLVPVAELMTYIRFTRPGNMKIFGWIIDGSVGRKYLHKMFTQKSDNSWRTDVIEYDGSPVKDISHAYIGASRDVFIPYDVFGSEPNPKLKWFANLWHDEGLQDECHFRKRLILAVTLKWFPVALWIVFILSFRVLRGIVLSIAGWPQNVVWKYMWKPFDYTTDMSICDNKKTDETFHFGNQAWWQENRFLVQRKTKHGVHNHIFFQAFNPLLIIVWAFFGFLSTSLSLPPSMMAAEIVVFVGHATLFIAGILAIIDLLFALFIFICDSSPTINRFLEKLPTQQILAGIIISCVVAMLGFTFYQSGTMAVVGLGAAMLGLGAAAFITNYLVQNWLTLGYIDPKYNDPTYIRELLCPKDGMNLEPTYALIPKDQRTVRLWVKKVKNSLCRPMQR